ncbi:hypothetical protein AA0X71_18870 [Robertmurraya sp. 2P01SA]|uniref:hypothetical protein n=1 Tax=Robertmurraya sp. 2P01SA TaxID=3132300 RepID=UPI0039A67834
MELDLGILAKLMVLEYTHLDLFRELYVWQVKNEGFAIEFEELEEIFIEEDEKEDIEETKKKFSSSWFKPIVYQWGKVAPTLNDKDLRKYFYLAKESIKEKGISLLNLTANERQWINDITAEGLHDSIRRKNIEEFKNDSTLNHSKIIKGIIAKCQSNREENLSTLLLIYEFFTDYRNDIIKELKKIRKINPPTILRLNLLKEKNLEHYNETKNHYITEKIISVEKWEQIEKLSK